MGAAGCASNDSSVEASEGELLTPADETLVDGCLNDPSGAAACLTAEAQARLEAKLRAVEEGLAGARGGLRGTAFEGGRVAYRIATQEACLEKPRVIWEQMKEAIEFVGKIHEDRGGRPTRLFEGVDVCMAHINDQHSPIKGAGRGGELLLQGARLLVGAPNRGLTGLFGARAQNFQELRSRWDGGEMFAGNPALQDSIGRAKVWAVANPVGSIYLQAVPVLEGAAARLIDRLAAVKGAGELAAQKAELVAAIEANTSVNVQVDGGRLGDVAKGAVANMDAPALAALVDAWSQALARPSLSDDAMEALGVAQIQQTTSPVCEVKVRQFCAINVQNVHCINVSVSLGAQQVLRFVERPEERPANRVDATQIGLVCVQTNDFVDVNLDVASAMRTGALASALGL
jgi:hypothetical protein